MAYESGKTGDQIMDAINKAANLPTSPLGTAALANTSDFDAAGTAAGLISGLGLGTASKSNVEDFDAAGTAAGLIAGLNLGTASQANVGDFDAAGTAAGLVGALDAAAVGALPITGGTATGNLGSTGTLSSGASTVADLPDPTGLAPGSYYFATDGLKSGEDSGSGTGVPVWTDGTSWLTFYDNTEVQA